MPDEVQFAIDQLRRILESFGWVVVATDTSGPFVSVTVQKPKDKIIKK